MIKRRSVSNFLNVGIYTPIGKYELAEKIAIGTLVGFNDDGLLVSVEKGADTIRPVGVITEGSTVTIEDARYLPNGKNEKEIGDFQELYRAFDILGVEALDGVAGGGKWKVSDIGTPVFVDKGKLTITSSATAIKVGFLGCPHRKEIKCEL